MPLAEELKNKSLEEIDFLESAYSIKRDEDGHPRITRKPALTLVRETIHFITYQWEDPELVGQLH